MSPSTRFRLGCTFAVMLSLCGTSCSRQASKERSLARAEAYQASGAMDKAEIEYLNTLKADPQTGKAYAQLGLIYAEQGRMEKAYGFLRKARELEPSNLEVRARLVLFYLATKKLEEARTEARFVLERQPNHTEAPLLLAECALQPKDIAEAKEFLLKLSSAQSAPVLTALAALEFRQRHLNEAEDLLKRAQSIDPKSAAITASLGTIYLAQKNLKAAEEAFAVSWQNAAVRSPQKLSFVRYKLQSGDLVGARQMLVELVSQAPDLLQPMMLLADINVREKKFDEALVLTQEILGRDPLNSAAMMLTARLHLAKGEPEKAQRVLEKLISLQPKNPETHYQFALTYLAQGNSGKATTSLNQALSLAPGYVDAILVLADLNLKKGDAKAASTSLKPLVAEHPELIPAKFLLARAEASLGNYSEALSLYQAVAAASPRDSTLLLPIALLHRQQKRYDEARKVLAQILELAPDTGTAIEQLVDLDLIAGNNAAARQRAEALQAKQPDKTVGYLLLAKICLAEKNLPQAEVQLLKVIELQPDSAVAYYLLAGIYSQSNRDSKALSQLEQVALKTPGNPSLFMRIALLQTRLNDYAAARTAYEKVLALDPRFLPALNNLAYLQAEQFNDLEQAAILAQKARDQAPHDPNVADTLGWILHRQGQFQRARSLLLESAAKLPDDAVVQSHLGLAHYMMGETESARPALQRALQLNPELPDKALVSQRLAILVAVDGPSGPALRAALEKSIAANKDDPVALTRLGALLITSGDLDQAQKHLAAALAINPRSVNANLAMIQLYLARHQASQALDLAKTIRQQAPDDPSVYHQLGRVAFQLGEYSWAASLLQEAAGRSPDDMGVLWDWAKAAYSIGRVADAEEAMQRVLKNQPLSPDAPEIRRHLEMISLASQFSPDAGSTIERALLADSDFVPALFASGAWAAKQGKADAARQAYEKVLAKYPDFTPAKRNLVLLAAAANESESKAYDLAVQVREALPRDPEVAQAFGILAYRKGDFSRAIGLLKESIEQLGPEPRRTFFLGLAQYRSKDKAARSTLQQALEMGLKDEPAVEARRIIAELK